MSGVSCFCTSNELRSALKECIIVKCTGDERAAASEFQAQLCSNGTTHSSSRASRISFRLTTFLAHHSFSAGQPTHTIRASTSSAIGFTDDGPAFTLASLIFNTRGRGDASCRVPSIKSVADMPCALSPAICHQLKYYIFCHRFCHPLR